MSPQIFVGLFIAFFSFELALEIYLNKINIAHIKKNDAIPHDFKNTIDDGTYQKSQKC